MKLYDAIVLGMGGVGSAALYHLARRGVRAAGFDRFAPPHDRGSTHGQSRVIRQAYFEHPNYVPLLLESYRLWRDLEAVSGRKLLHEVGLIEIGPPEGTVVSGVLRAANEHRIAVESLTASEVMQRWPGLRVDHELAGVFEPTGGYLLVEECVSAHLDAARSEGAHAFVDTEVVSWHANEREVRVVTSRGEFGAGQLILAPGVWASGLLGGLPLGLHVRRKSLFWLETRDARYEVGGGFPVFLFDLPAGVFYGFPKLDRRGVKVAEHSGGQVVDDPLSVDRAIDPHDQRRILEFASGQLPGVSARILDHSVCLYTMSPDEHFIIDRHPRHGNVVFAAGLSGHGFKFVPTIAAALASMAVTAGAPPQLEFLRLARFQ